MFLKDWRAKRVNHDAHQQYQSRRGFDWSELSQTGDAVSARCIEMRARFQERWISLTSISNSPTMRLDSNLSTSGAYLVPRPGLERQRERVLNEAEIKTLWNTLNTEPADLAAAMRLALLTAQRKSEVLEMTWAELDLDGGWWIIPAERAKNNIAHRVPLDPRL